MATLRDLELRHLLALQAVAVERSFGRAAKKLGFTQSAVSQQIAALERVVGEPVFDRPGGPRPVELTPVGRLLLDHAHVILARVRLAETELASLAAGESGRLVIGTFQSVSVRILPELLGRIRAERPGIEIQLVELDETDELVHRLVAGELDGTFLVGQVDGTGLEVTPLFEDPFVVVEPATAGSAPSIGVRELTATPLVGQSANTCQAMIDANLRNTGYEPVYAFRSNDNGAVQAMVRAGVGRAILPLLAVELDDPGITVRSIDPPLPPRVIVFARALGRSRVPALDRFVELARQICAPYHTPCDAIAGVQRSAAAGSARRGVTGARRPRSPR
jgi:DNA-binding transcriptional LysR family regulator